jgi:hypothetical protein
VRQLFLVPWCQHFSDLPTDFESALGSWFFLGMLNASIAIGSSRWGTVGNKSIDLLVTWFITLQFYNSHEITAIDPFPSPSQLFGLDLSIFGGDFS